MSVIESIYTDTDRLRLEQAREERAAHSKLVAQRWSASCGHVAERSSDDQSICPRR